MRRRPARRPSRSVPVDVAGFRGEVRVCADGRPDAPALVLLHGFSGSLRWFDLVVPRLSDAFRLVRLDLLGHGGTGGPAADAPVQARVVEAVLQALELDDVTVLGHSFGADVAVELAELSPRVDRLVIVAQAPDYSDATLPRARMLMTLPVLGGALGRIFQSAAAGAGLLVRRRGPRPGDPLALQGIADFRALNLAMFRVVLVQRRDRMARRPLDEQVRAAGKPTLVVLGGRDHFYGARSAGRYRAAGARVEVLAESGHSPLVDSPGEIAELVRGFVLGRALAH